MAAAPPSPTSEQGWLFWEVQREPVRWRGWAWALSRRPSGSTLPDRTGPKSAGAVQALDVPAWRLCPCLPRAEPTPLGHGVSHSGAPEELPRTAWGPLWPFLLSVLSLTHCPRWQGSVVECLCPESVSPSKGPSNVSPAGAHPPSLLVVSTSLHECPWGAPDSEKPAAPWPRGTALSVPWNFLLEREGVCSSWGPVMLLRPSEYHPCICPDFTSPKNFALPSTCICKSHTSVFIFSGSSGY